MQEKTILSSIIDFIFGRKYYATIFNTRGTTRCELNSYIFSSKEEAEQHKIRIESTAPVYFWAELETYRAGHERLSSESTMHTDCRGLSGEELVKAKSEMQMGKMLKKVDFFSYQCLRNIVKQRHDHRLPEWHAFVDWVKTLPFAEELILTE